MNSITILAETVVSPDWQLFVWPVLAVVVIVLIAMLIRRTRKP